MKTELTKKQYRASIALSITIYVITVLYALFSAPVLDSIGVNSEGIAISFLCLITNFVIELIIIVIPAAVLAKKFALTVKCMPVIIVALLCPFAIFTPPAWYLLVLTAAWGGGILFEVDAMSSAIASLFVTAQYALIIYIVILICQHKRKKSSPTDISEKEQQCKKS